MLGYASEHMICRAYVGPHLHLMAKRIKGVGEKEMKLQGNRFLLYVPFTLDSRQLYVLIWTVTMRKSQVRVLF